METAQKFLQNLVLSRPNSSSVKTYRLNEKNGKTDDYDDDSSCSEIGVSNQQSTDYHNSGNKSSGWHNNQAADLKGRIKASLTNARYGLTLKRKSSFSDKSPICMLGNLYNTKQSPCSSSSVENNNNPFNSFKLRISSKNSSKRRSNLDGGHNFEEDNNGLLSYEQFLEDFKTRIWFTYRRGFNALPGSKLDSDCGWGCMLRCGQMLVAQALMCHLGRTAAFDKTPNDDVYRKVIKEFLDLPESLLSIHRLVEIGQKNGKSIGDWFGPASVAFVLKYAVETAGYGPNFRNSLLENFRVYVSLDGVVCTDEIESLLLGNNDEHERRASNCSTNSAAECKNSNFSSCSTDGDRAPSKFVFDRTKLWTKSLLLIVPLRLGTESTNSIYIHHLKTLLSLKCCVGLIGGKPKRSLYFVGWHDDSLIYLDPHYCQDAVDKSAVLFPLQSFFCDAPRKMSFQHMDPSCAVGFYLHDRNDLLNLLTDLSEVVDFGNDSVKYPLFSVVHVKEDAAERKCSISSFSEVEKDSRSNSLTSVLKPRFNSISSSKGYVLL